MRAESEDDVVVAWRGSVDDSELVDLVVSHGGKPVRGWWDTVSPHPSAG